MPKRKRREQQHLRQESARRRSYQVGGTAPQEIYRPGFPMNLLSNVKAFYVIGAGVAVIMVVGLVLSGRVNNTNVNAGDIATPTPSPTLDPSATPTATPTPDPKKFSAAEQILDPTKDYRAVFKTNKGDFTITLRADLAPNTVNSFVFLAQKNFYDGVIFHRVINNFIIQAGDPTGTGAGPYPGYTTADEPNQLRNTRGMVSMAKQPGKSEFGSQFFINLKTNPNLDFDNTTVNKYYPFGEVTAGMDVVDAIARAAVDANDKPTDPVIINDVVIETSNK